jgi:uncharacterized protein YjeT (DUF2065 family)
LAAFSGVQSSLLLAIALALVIGGLFYLVIIATATSTATTAALNKIQRRAGRSSAEGLRFSQTASPVSFIFGAAVTKD